MAVDTNRIAEHMEVVAADGETIGKVDHVENGKIKLTKNDSPDGQHHLVPFDWVARVDQKIHLNKSLADIRTATGSQAPQAKDATPDVGVHDAVPKV